MQISHGIFDRPSPNGNLNTDIEELRDDAKSVARQVHEFRQCLFYRDIFTDILVVKFAAEERTPDNKRNEDEADIRHTYPEQLRIADRF